MPGDCPREQELIEFCDERLQPRRRDEIRKHLESCTRCEDAVLWIRARLQRPFDPVDDMPSADDMESTQFLANQGPVFDESNIDRSLFSPSRNDQAIGRLGKYDILRMLGQGGMGVVLQGHNEQLRRDVAIKMLNRSLSANPVARRRFIREARAAAAINHPNVVITHDVDEHRGVPFIVMEMVSGRTLHAEIRREVTLEPIRVIRLSAQIALGLASAHAQGVIHRDIKPGNIMLEDQVDRVKIADFGLARAAIDNIELTSRELAVGTPAYMSPEQVRGDHIDARSDLFALGCVIHAMLTGHSPFHGRNALEMARKVEMYRPLNLHKVNPATPVFLAEIVDKLLAKDPDHRFQSAAEVADVLNRHLAMLNQAHSDQVANLLQTPMLKSEGSVASSPAAPAQGEMPAGGKRGANKVSWAYWGGAFAVLLLLACGAVVGRPALRSMLGENDRESPIAPSSPPSLTSSVPSSVPSSSANAGDETPGPVGAQPTRPAPRTLTVGKTGEASFRTLREALAAAAPGATIRVVDDGRYEEALEVGGPRHAGLTLISAHGATLAVPPATPTECHTLRLRDARDVTVRGFTVHGFVHGSAGMGHAIFIEGSAAGVILQDLTCDSSSTTGPYATVQVFISAATPGAAPCRIERCTITNRGSSQCVWLHRPAHDVVLTECVFSSNKTNVALWESCRGLEFTHNVFLAGEDGIGVAMRDWPTDCNLRISNNTFFNTYSWIAFDSDSVIGGQPILVNNLILGSKLIGMTEEHQAYAATAWTIGGNHWERGPETDAHAGRDGEIATLHEAGSIAIPRDPSEEDFLIPPAGSVLRTAGQGAGLPRFVGAKDRDE